MAGQPRLKLYELAAKDDQHFFSPPAWTARFALAHKQLAFESVPWRLVEKDKIAFSGQKLVPVLVDGDKVVHDSWEILKYLDKTYPDRPSLFGPEGTGEAAARFFHHWFYSMLLRIAKFVVLDIEDTLHPMDREYFRETRQGMLGMTLEQAANDVSVEEVRELYEPLRKTLAEYPFLGGSAPNAIDLIAIGGPMWLRAVSTVEVFGEGDPLRAWTDRMLDLNDGMARSLPCKASVLAAAES